METMNDMSENQTATLAGVAWLLTGGLLAYLAYQQWTMGELTGVADWSTLAMWNGASAAITFYFAARLLSSPTRNLLTQSVWWAIINGGLGGYQIVSDPNAVGEVFVGAVIVSAIAGVLSFVARQNAPVPAVSALSGRLCGRCGKPLSPAWKAKCNHCSASFAEFPPIGV